MIKPSLVAAALLVGGFASAVQAADMPPLFGQAEDADVLPPQTYAFGAGWYLRGDVGWGETTPVIIDANLPSPTARRSWDGDVGVGYRWASLFRTDLTFGLHEGRHLDSDGGLVTCAYNLQGITSQDGSITYGYDWSPQTGTCTGRQSVYLDQAEVLANGYFDLGTWYGITPYIGAGVGAARVATSGTSAYYRTSDGSLYAPDLSSLGGFPLVWVNAAGTALSPQPTVPGTTRPVAFAPQNWKTTIHRTHYNLAWALMGGVSYAIDNHLKIDLGYRYLNDGSVKSLPDQNGNMISKTLITQEVRLGVRYEIE